MRVLRKMILLVFKGARESVGVPFRVPITPVSASSSSICASAKLCCRARLRIPCWRLAPLVLPLELFVEAFDVLR